MDSSPSAFSSITNEDLYTHSSGNFSVSFVCSSGQSFPTVSLLPPAVPECSIVSLWDACVGFQFFLNTVFIGVLCLIGFVGNTISFLVFRRDRHNRVPVFLLQSLAVADNSVLCTAFIALSVFYGIVPIAGQKAEELARPYIVRYLNPLACVAQSCTIWMTVLLAINRYLAVCRPFTTRKWLTMTHARIQVFSVVFFSVLVNIPRVFETDMYPSISNATAQTAAVGTTSFPNSTSASSAKKDRSAHWYFEVVYLNAFYTSVVLVLPILLLVGFNIPLLRQLQASKREMIRNSLSYSGHQENNITVVMVIIILEMIVCHSPDRVVQIIRIFFSSKSNRSCPSPLYYAINVANFLVILNSSTDFVVYYGFRNRFRTLLRDQVFCRRPRSDSRDFGPWNSRADLGVNGRRPSAPPVQRIDKDGQDRAQPSPESNHQVTSLLAKNDKLATEQDHHETTSFVL